MAEIKPNQFQMALIKSIGIPQFLEQQEQLKAIHDIEVKVNTNENYELMENKVWYEGKAEKLEYFYKTNMGPFVYRANEFYREVNTNVPRVHYPLPSAISNAFGTLLFNTNPFIGINTGNKTRDDKLNARLTEILDVNDFLNILQQSAQKQSYSGSVALKLNIDQSIADVPLITIYAKEDFVVHRKYNQTIFIRFFDYYKGEYKLETTYGRGYISYKLFKGKRQVPLADIPETEGLKDTTFFDENGQILPVIFAEVIDNKSGGRSDYDGLVSTFHALDETYSAMVNYIRRTKPNIFITEDIAKKDASGKALPLNEFDNVLTVLDGTPTGEATAINRDIHNIQIQGYVDAFIALREMILVKINLSPATIGLRAAGGARESSEALKIREQASLRSRTEKLSIWQEKLRNFLFAMITLDQLMNEATQEREGVYRFQKQPKFGVTIEFGEFYEPSLTDRVTMFSAALEKGLCSIDFAIAQTWGNQLSDIELMQLMIQTKMEKNIPLTKEQEDFLKANPNFKFSSIEFKD
jgi:hypothetical protein